MAAETRRTWGPDNRRRRTSKREEASAWFAKSSPVWACVFSLMANRRKAKDLGILNAEAFDGVGVTGHYRPESLMEAIRRFPFDTILMAVNAADPHHFSFQDHLLPMAVERQMGIIGMKLPARGRLLDSWTPPPIEEQQRSWEGAVIAKRSGVLSMREAIYYTMTLPVSTVIVGCDSVEQLEQNVQLAGEFTPFNAQQIAALTDHGSARGGAGSLLPVR